jgi:hypothetical protein
LDFSSNDSNRLGPKAPKLKRYEQVWTRNADHINRVKSAWNTSHGNIADRLNYTLNALHNWGSNIFGILPRKIKKTQNELMEMQRLQEHQDITQQIVDKENELDRLLDGEEIWWKQRSGADWLQHGDKNTKFFHMKASQRKKRNTIRGLLHSEGVLQTNHDMIEEILLNHFKLLFQSQPTHQINETVTVVKDKLNKDMKDMLSKEFHEAEVYNAIKDMKSLAAPGPDGLPAIFYHTYWDIVGQDVTKEVLDILNHNSDPSYLNHTHICLIPKIPNPTMASDFRPISLCNITLKIVTKTIANRLKNILPDIISPNQSAFLQGRLITDNTLIAHEIFHFFSQSHNKKGFVGIKTDMAKAYDRVE